MVLVIMMVVVIMVLIIMLIARNVLLKFGDVNDGDATANDGDHVLVMI